jgi:hypothetical protein
MPAQAVEIKGERSHMPLMRTHPHAEASYRIVALSGGAFGVEVSIPDSYPTTVKSFATEADAEEWIARSQQRVAAEGQTGKWFKRPDRRS